MWTLLLLPAALARPPIPDAVQAIRPYRPLREAWGIPPISDQDRARAAAGETVVGLVRDGEGQGRAWAVTEMDAPVEDLWAVLLDEERFVRQTLGGRTWRLEGEPCGPDRLALVQVPVPLVADRWWMVRYRVAEDLLVRSHGAARELSWVEERDLPSDLDRGAFPFLEEGVQVPFSRGAWFLVDLPLGRTWVEYHLSAGLGPLPEGAVPVLLQALRRTLRNLEDAATLMGSLSPCEGRMP